MGRTVYIFSNSYLPVLGGIQTVTSQLAEGIISRGIKCRVITKLYPLKLKFSETINGLKVLRLPFFTQEHKARNMFFNHVSLLFTFILFLFHRPDVVFVHFPEAQVWTLIKLQKFFDFKIITCFHGHDIMRYKNQASQENTLQWKSLNILLNKSICATACSKFIANQIKSILKPPCPVVHIYNGVDLKRFRQNQPNQDIKKTFKRDYIFAWGRLEEKKGFHLLITAFSQIALNKPSLDLIIAGEGSQRKELEKLISSYNLNNRISLIGKKSQSEIVILSKNAILNVISSLQEPFGIVGLEAIAAERPIVCTNTDGLSEFMSDFATLVKPDVESLKKGIISTLNSPNLDSKSVSQFLNSFSIEIMVNNYLSLIN